MFCTSTDYAETYMAYYQISEFLLALAVFASTFTELLEIKDIDKKCATNISFNGELLSIDK